MRLKSWQVLSLPRVECYLPRHFGAALPLRHLGTMVQPEPLSDGRRMGDTVWGTIVGGQLAAVSWDWIEILPAVVCMVDPSNALSSIRFLDADDCYEEPAQAILTINRLIYETPWQEAVCSCLVAEQSDVRQPVSVRWNALDAEAGSVLRRAA
jgi:hypothetical protein